MRDPHPALQDFVQFALVQQLRVSSLDALQLDGDLLSISDVDAKVDVAETARANLPDQSILAPDYELRAGGRGSAGHGEACKPGIISRVARPINQAIRSFFLTKIHILWPDWRGQTKPEIVFVRSVCKYT